MDADEEFLARLLETFRIEADEHFDVLSNGLLEIERDPEATDHLQLVETLFREAHSLKGAARAVELTEIEAVCQAMESVFAAWKRGEIGPSQGLFDTLNEAVDTLHELSATSKGDSASTAEALAGLIGRLHKLSESAGGVAARPAAKVEPKSDAGGTGKAAAKAEPAKPVPATVAEEPRPRRKAPEPAPAAVGTAPAPAPAPAPGPRADVQGDTIRVSLTRLTDLMLRMEELITVKLVMRQRSIELADLLTAFDVWKKRWTVVRSQIREPGQDVWLADPPEDDDEADAKRRGTDSLLEYIDWNAAFVADLATRIGRLTLSSENDMRSLGPLVGDLLEDVKTLVMLPFSSLSASFPKMMRDLARAEGKAVDLTVTGGDIEIDRHVLETMKDPIVHILRNCVGHGIETPDIRAKRGKPVRGAVRIDVTRVEGNKLSITIGDDGGGIDAKALRNVAVKSGARSQEQLESLDEHGLVSLVFESGVSTNPIVTDVSGRGIGLAIVQEKVEQLGGSVHVKSTPGRGASFELIVPATLASSRGVIVRVADRVFVLPTLHVDRVTRTALDDIVTVENSDTIMLDGQPCSFVFLHDVLALPRKPRTGDPDLLPVVVLTSGGERIAFAVDWILGEQEVLVKGLGPQLENVRYVTGATVLESERVALILHPPEVMRAATYGTVQITTVADVAADQARTRKLVLVAEDSITSRTLLKNILETAGYEVRTVVDGVEAMTALGERDFDLVITDIEMPRMNGFDLTARIRADARLSQLPVMLVTSLESREDRERGVDVGANAYITKGSFDQTTLLETARRLV